MKKIINVLSGVVTVAAVLSSGLANAKGSKDANKAEVTKISLTTPYNCEYIKSSLKYCFSSKTNAHKVSTSSGNVRYNGSTTTDFEYYFQGELVYASTDTQEWKQLTKNGATQVNTSSSTSTSADAGTSMPAPTFSGFQPLIQVGLTRSDVFSIGGTDFCIINTTETNYKEVNGKVFRDSVKTTSTDC